MNVNRSHIQQSGYARPKTTTAPLVAALSTTERSTPMKIGLFTPLRSPVATPEFLREFGQKAEAMGIHSFWLGEHVVLFDNYESKYPGTQDGVFRFPEGSGLMDLSLIHI